MTFNARRRDRPTTLETGENIKTIRTTGNNQEITCTLIAPGVLKMNYIVFIYGCYSDPALDRVGTVEWGGTAWQYFTTKNPVAPSKPMATFPNSEVTVRLPASGTVGVWGSLTVVWYSKGYIT